MTAFLAFLAACGEGTPINLADSSEWRDIQNDLLDIVEENGRIKDCNTPHSGSLECPEYVDKTPSSSSFEEPPPPPPPSSSSANIITPSSSSPGISSAVVPSSSGTAGVSSSSAVVGGSSSAVASGTLTCGTVASSGTVGTAVTSPEVQCNGQRVASGNVTWAGTPSAPNWNSPAAGTYSNIKATAVSGDCKDKTANCTGTLTVTAAPSSSSRANNSSSSVATPSSSSGNIPSGGSVAFQGATWVELGPGNYTITGMPAVSDGSTNGKFRCKGVANPNNVEYTVGKFNGTTDMKIGMYDNPGNDIYDKKEDFVGKTFVISTYPSGVTKVMCGFGY